jgi:hypothetical protein
MRWGGQCLAGQVLQADSAALIEALVTVLQHVLADSSNYKYFHPGRLVIGQLFVREWPFPKFFLRSRLFLLAGAVH